MCLGSTVLWNLEEASHKTILLEAFSVKIVGSIARWSMKFGWSLARNDHYGSFFCEKCRKHHAKRSFWKLVLWNLEEASHETIILEAFSEASRETFVLEARSVKFVGSLARNDHFGSFFAEIWRKPCTKRSFCELLLWNLEEASRETIVLEAAYSVKIVGSLARNDQFGSFLCANCRKSRAKRLFWKLLLRNLEEASHETIIWQVSSAKVGGSLARNDNFASFFCEIWRKPCFWCFFCGGVFGVFFWWWCFGSVLLVFFF